MKCPSLSLKQRCLDYFNNLSYNLTFYFLIVDNDTKFLYKIKYKNKKIYFLAESQKYELIDQIKEIFPKKNFEFGNNDIITISLFNGNSKFMIALEKTSPASVMWGGSGIFYI